MSTAAIGVCGRRRARLIGGGLIAVCAAMAALAWAPGTARAQGPVGPAVFFTVVYQGSGAFAIDGSADDQGGSGFNGPFHEDLTFSSWSATFPAVMLGVSGAVSGSAPVSEQQLAWHAEVTDTDCDDVGNCQNDDCLSSYKLDPDSSALALAGAWSSGVLNLSIEAPWQPTLESAGCLAIALPDPPLPDLLRAVTTIPLAALAKGSVTKSVSSSDSGTEQLSADCTAEAQADNSEVTGCTRTWNWQGTVTITPDCVSGNGSGAPWCIHKKQKDDAAKAAQFYTQMVQEDKIGSQIDGACNHAGNVASYQSGASGACVGETLHTTYDRDEAQDMQQIADDPPDANFAHVTKPLPPPAPHLTVVRRRAPAMYRLVRSERQIAALEAAVMSAQNRASGAFLAVSDGDAGAAGALTAQDRAVVHYARQAAALLHGRHRLALAAAAELRGIAATVHGRGSRRLRSSIRRFAAIVAARPGARADMLAASALSGIGR